MASQRPALALLLIIGYKLVNPGLGQGFNVYCGNAIWPHNEEGLENLARYIIRASFSQERIMYIPADESSDSTAKVIYESKDGKTKKTFDALDWVALLTTHIPNRGESCWSGSTLRRLSASGGATTVTNPAA